MHDKEINITRAIEQSRLNPAAFKPVYEAYFTRIYRYCLRRVGHRQEAEDLTSQIFTHALINLPRYRGGSFPAWLFTIAHNILANHFRSQQFTVPLENITQPGIEDDPLGQLINVEEYQRVSKFVANLPTEQRDLLSLRIAGRLSAKEIGVVIGKSEGAVRVALHRIVQKLRLECSAEEER